MKKIWVVDLGEETVTVLAVQPQPDGTPRLLGRGDAPSQGLLRGEIVNIGDAAESLAAAVRAAESSSGLKCENIFYNFDDSMLESQSPAGSVLLSGEGQIRTADVQRAAVSALRYVSRFERTVVYSQEVNFLIDEKDAVVNPVGVFGRQLDVFLYVLTARAEHVENWQRVVSRARLKKGIPVLSILSSVHGVLNETEKKGRTLVWDLGQDVLSAAVFDHGCLREYIGSPSRPAGIAEMTEWASQACKKICESSPGIEQVILTGDRAENDVWVEKLSKAVPLEVRVAAPAGLPGLDRPKYASLAGLLRFSCLWQPQGRASQHENFLAHVQQKTASLISEYF